MPPAKFTKVPTPTQLRRMYVTKRMSLRAIERETGASMPTIRGWLAAAGISTRTISEAKRGQKPAEHTVLASVRARRKKVLPGRPEVGYNLDGYGYVRIMVNGRRRKEHRVVMEQMLGRPLKRSEDVHHKNGVRHDNRPENLELMASRADHQREHSKTRRRVGGRFAS